MTANGADGQTLAEWENIYKDTQIRSGEFTSENGEKQTVEFMSSTEFNYLENDAVTGFMKPYGQ